MGTEGALNYGGYSNEAVDQLLLEFAGAEDRAGAARRLMAGLQADAPIAPICFKSYAVLTHLGVVDALSPAPGNIFRGMENWTVHLKEAEENEAASAQNCALRQILPQNTAKPPCRAVLRCFFAFGCPELCNGGGFRPILYKV